MTPAIASSLLPLLRRLDPERAHGLALRALRLGLAGSASGADDPAMAVSVLGLSFRNPIGLAAGFDKDGTAIGGLARLGFGFLEIGTLTPRPQSGNPRPRMFRLSEDRAVINRMGFNNGGLEACLARLAAQGKPSTVPLGINLGINKEGADPERDYPAMVGAAASVADYLVINVSSPNTPGLRDLQAEDRLRAILHAVRDAAPQRPPLLVKLAPDLADDAIPQIVESCIEGGVQGLIISNTTIARPAGLRSPLRTEAGGLSGPPLFARSTAVLAHAYLAAQGRLTLIGVGGISSGQDALTKLRAGASLVQLYTGFAFAGPALISRLVRELAAALRAAGFARPGDAVGSAARELARCST
ncbi:MAG: quinone-dependent dihydroorotate dehydrogenase [Proteobacteria bacterium]|nr:quinone-dependent dihydroorotate dehydrogenase [Pseudomonadota bacterium]